MALCGFWFAKGVSICYNLPMDIQSATDVYVDTCFLMNEPGLRYLERENIRVKVISSVLRELRYHAEQNNPMAKTALETLGRRSKKFDILEQANAEEHELDCRGDKKPTADRVFRSMAVRGEDFGRKLCFLTTDTALADALSGYEGVTVYWFNSNDEKAAPAEWSTCKENGVKAVQKRLTCMMKARKYVLTSSALTSAGCRQFLENIAAIDLQDECLPILHEESVDELTLHAHLEQPVRLLLKLTVRRRKRRTYQGERIYRSEAALLDDVYFSGSAEQDVCVLVAGEDELVSRYRARSRGAEQGAAAVSFCVLNVYGEPYPLLKAWHLLKDKEAAQTPTEPAPATPEKTLPTPLCLVEKRFKDCCSKHTNAVSSIVKNATASEVEKELGKISSDEEDLPYLRLLCFRLASRQKKCKIMKEMLKCFSSMPPYLFNDWASRGKNKEGHTAEALLESGKFTNILIYLIDHTQDLQSCTAGIGKLVELSKSKSVSEAVHQHAEKALRRIQEHGVEVKPG